jgi:eukaryotic-like serine/threonine-protein kinase
MAGVQSLRPNDHTDLGGYRLLGRLGEGGMGTVYLAEDGEGRKVALKVIRDHLLDRPEFRARFRGEVDRVKNVPPFCTAEVIDADPEHEPPYLVVEYVDGPSLAEIVRDSGPLSGAALHSIGLGMATALTAIHNCGVIHRDLKPANVLLPRGGVKVIDFGLARETGGSTQLTHSDQVMGTIPYIAPERLGNGLSDVTPASDIFAWGAVMVYAATGHTPFAADSPASTAIRILTEEPNLDGVTGPLRDIVSRALSKSPHSRPTARQLLDELISLGATRAVSTEVLRPAEAAQAMEPSLGLFRDGDYDSGPSSSPRRRSLLLAAGVAVVAGLATAAVFAASYILGDPGANALNTPTPAPSAVSLEPSVSPSVSPSPSVPPRVLPAIPEGWYKLVPDDPLTATQYWTATSNAKNGSCVFQADGLVATSTLSYQCKKLDSDRLRDLIAVSRMKLRTKDACGAFWLRYNATSGGYVVRICSTTVYVDELVLEAPKPGRKPVLKPHNRSIGRLPAAEPLKAGEVVEVWLLLTQDRLEVFINGMSRAEFGSLRATSGLFTMGIQQDKAAKTAQSVTFSDLILWRPPYVDPPSPSPSVSPSPRTSPSPSPSPSGSIAPSP